MKNYPIFSTRPQWSKQVLKRYLIVFNKHRIRHVFTRGLNVRVSHIFDDGLHIDVWWEIKNRTMLSKLHGMSPMEFFYNEDNGYLGFVSFAVISTSKIPYDTKISPFIEQEYDYVMRADKFSYERAEFKVRQPSTIPDFFFDDLIHSVECLNKFNQYLSKTGENING